MKINYKIIYVIMILSLIFLTGCSNVLTGNVIKEKNVSLVEAIEVYHFHSDIQCNTCKTIGANLDETIERYFLDEVESKKIVYGHINVQDPKNSEITERYGAQGTSLWIGIHGENEFHAEDIQGIWYKLQDKEEFIEYLKLIIEKRLSGKLN